jgi:hypothetical protein
VREQGASCILALLTGENMWIDVPAPAIWH